MNRKLDVSDSGLSIRDAVDDIEDNLYYFSDVISSGVPDLGRLLTDNILQLLVFPFLLPSFKKQISVSFFIHTHQQVRVNYIGIRFANSSFAHLGHKN